MGCPLPGGLTVKRFVINWGGDIRFPSLISQKVTKQIALRAVLLSYTQN